MENRQNPNEFIRTSLFKKFQTSQNNGHNLDTIIEFHMRDLYNMQSSKDSHVRLLFQLQIATYYLDTYKLINYSIFNNNQSFDEMELITIFDKLEDFDDILAMVSASPDILGTMIEYCYQFAEKTFPGKVLVTKSLTKEMNEELLDIIPQHELDLNYYDRIIDTSFLTLSHQQIEKLSLMEEKYAGYDLIHGLNNIKGFLKNLYMIDRENAISIFTKIIIQDYEWSKYCLSNHLFDDEIAELEAIERIEFFEDEEMRIDEIIDLYLTDDKTFEPLIESFIDIELDTINFGRKDKITKEAVKHYKEKNLLKKIERKIKNETN